MEINEDFGEVGTTCSSTDSFCRLRAERNLDKNIMRAGGGVFPTTRLSYLFADKFIRVCITFMRPISTFSSASENRCSHRLADRRWIPMICAVAVYCVQYQLDGPNYCNIGVVNLVGPG